MKSANIEFDENAAAHSLLFSLPFNGDSDQINIKFKSNELNDTMINKFFELDFKSFMLKSRYNLDEIQIDLIELVFICSTNTTASTMSSSQLATNSKAATSNTFLLYITINDVNNKVPEFINEPYKFSLNEVLFDFLISLICISYYYLFDFFELI